MSVAALRGGSLRIAQIAPIARAVSPASTGSIEQLVWLLTEHLVERGHDVTLFATGHSTTSAKLAGIYPLGYDDDESLWEWTLHELLHAAAAMEQAKNFDVVHSHVYHFALPFTRLVPTPVVHTYHVLPDDDVAAAYGRYPEARLVAVSEFQRSELRRLGLPDVPVIHHGLDFGRFPFRPRGGDYLAFLGALTWAKGAVNAIEVARAAGMPLLLAGARDDDFEETIEPLLGDGVEYLGWIQPEERNELVAGAAALLYPVNLGETFGLVMVEAMACGTPVLALDRGAVPEVVDDGVTGYRAHDLDQLVRAVPKALALDRAAVRAQAQERFDVRRMVDGYEELYEQLSRRATARTA